MNTDTENTGSIPPITSPDFKLCLRGSYANKIKNLLATIDSDEARKAIAYINQCINAANNRETCSLYSPSCKLKAEEIVNGEIVQVLGSLRFYASIYEPKTAATLFAAHELILRLIRNAEVKSAEKHRAKNALREAEDRIVKYEKENY